MLLVCSLVASLAAFTASTAAIIHTYRRRW